MTPREQEQRVCETALRLLCSRSGHDTVNVVARPEQQDRQRPSVELHVRIGPDEWVVEHTRIESYPGQIEGREHLVNLLEPLRAELRYTLPRPGSYRLAVDTGAATGIKHGRAVSVRNAVASWVRQQAPLLQIAESVSGKPDGVPFEITLTRSRVSDGEFVIQRFTPSELEDRRQNRIRLALEAKCPKLRHARGNCMKSLLVLESNDIQLANAQVIAEAAAKELETRADAPDFVYLVETELAEFIVWVLKEGTRLTPAVPDSGPHGSYDLARVAVIRDESATRRSPLRGNGN